MKYSDKPIYKPSQDILGRSNFSLELARAIDQLSIAKDGFVIAILASWGEGKSSVIELIIRSLQNIEMERAQSDSERDRLSVHEIEQMSEIYERVAPQVQAMEASNLNLNYWQRDARIADFRRWLKSDADALAAQQYWQLKFSVEQNQRTVVLRFSPWLISVKAEMAVALLSEMARVLGERLGDDVRRAFAAVLQRLSELAPVAGGALELATAGVGLGKVFSAGGNWSGAVARELSTGPSLYELREKLRTILAALDGRRVLVVVDDLDRLTPQEALEMVSLIKSLGDLPNVIYLLAYDEIKLAALIHEAIHIDGADFLGKIVQYPVHLPSLSQQDLARLLDADLTAILGNLSSDDQSRLAGTWQQLFRHYLRTPRDIRRYVNVIAVSLSSLAEHLNIVDLLMIELLRIYEPEVYRWVRQNIDDLVE
ncbi:KAP family P-loop NTPase fold protein [Undibacter mobilis]|uniref:KAP NTPase domain-containing protein n=1 Tax=Undibacter mobilis TaxID=2292256 RepID=A0A371BBK5_9BRAD|nr:P-loop NTPase fold protein [Undibacter mobilis]RDV04989.1 hypothetical protein DXH78_10700 [Undibacter mobilis]